LDLYEHRGKELLQEYGLETLRDRRKVSRSARQGREGIAFALRAGQP
jgi:hypothetical protein